MNADLVRILAEMDLPEQRRNIDAPHNIPWLLRNISIRNNKHPECQKAVEILKDLLKYETS